MRVLIFRAGAPLFAFVLLISVVSCRSRVRKLKSPPHYAFSEVFTDKLDLRLREISGITWDSKSNVFVANNDESGKLFFLDKETKAITAEYVFGNNGDYEDVALYNGVPYILRSDGMITRFMKDSSGKAYGVEAGKISLTGTNDFESMYYDAGRKALVILCKNCVSDDKKTVSAYAFYPDSIGFDNKPLYRIDVSQVEKLSPFSTVHLQPSAAAIHPILHKLFILSSASHQLVIADTDGQVESVYKLAAKLFPQPEGITFKQNGDMYISNEGVAGKSTLLKFVYRDSGNTASNNSSPYKFTAPDEKMELGNHLHEISGMAYIPDKDLILAENDEKGDIFTIDFKEKKDKLGKVKFGGKGDYEDIVYTDTAVYMLISSGTIVQVMTKDSSFATREFDLEKGGKNEFETMYLEPSTQSLILLCKECSHEKDEIRVAYRFNLATLSYSAEPAYTVRIADIRKILGDSKAEFKPSAAGINPVNGKLFIVASVGKLLVVADRIGRVEQVFRLDPAMYNQPEGLTFAPNGDLYISNEGGEGIATILKFNYRK